ncbi:MAG: cytochrome P450 [Chloroflexota bacterium]
MYDLFSPQFKANPFPVYAELRDKCPIYPHYAPYGARIWYITRYEDVEMVLKDGNRFVKDPMNAGKGGKKDGTPGKGKALFRMINRNMLFADPPDHSRLRRLVSLAFTPRRIEELAPRIAEIGEGLLEQHQRKIEIEMIDAFAFPFPVTVIMELLGIPKEDQMLMHNWSKAIIAPGRFGISLKGRKQRVRAFVNYLSETFECRRQEPSDDLISALVAAEEDGDRLNEQELSSMVALLFVTGHETVVNLIGNGFLALLNHPQELEKLRANRFLIDQALEEMLRYDGPVETSTTRWAAADLELGGNQIRRGDVIRVVITSANRDRDFCPHADDFQIERPPAAHLAFGKGLHYCLGAPLARLEGRIAFNLLLDRFTHMELAVPAHALEWHTGVIFRGLKELPVRVEWKI